MTHITLPRAVVEQALEALKLITDAPPTEYKGYVVDECEAAITSLRAALNEASKEVEPVAWLYLDKYGSLKLSQTLPHEHGAFPVFTHPAPAVPEGMVLVPKEPTEDMLDAMCDAEYETNGDAINSRCAKAIYKAMIAAAQKV